MHQLSYLKDTPYYDDRPLGIVVDTIVIHYTDMWTLFETFDLLKAKKVSCHYLIDETGDLYAYVPPSKRAWHAGQSQHLGRFNVNDFSIGIELQNPGEKYFKKYGMWKEYPKKQMDTLIELILSLNKPYVVGHSDIAPNRKKDPGPHFDWSFVFSKISS